MCNFIQKLSAQGISKAPFFSVSLETFALALRGPLGFFFEEARFSRFTCFFWGDDFEPEFFYGSKGDLLHQPALGNNGLFSAPKELWNINYNSYDTNSISFLPSVVAWTVSLP